jgi:hypothetical protein
VQDFSSLEKLSPEKGQHKFILHIQMEPLVGAMSTSGGKGTVSREPRVVVVVDRFPELL